MEGVTKTFRFKLHGRLNDFIKPHNRSCSYYKIYFQDRPSLKDSLEAQGIPHPEIGAVSIDGSTVGLQHTTPDGREVEIWPCNLALAIKGNRPAFILDVHLGTLARRMRLLGLDASYSNSFSDEQIIQTATKEHRVILTRDLGILKNSRVQVGYWLRADDPDAQVHEVVREFGIADNMEPLSRCLACNGRLKPAAKDAVLGKLPQRVARTFNEFHQCEACGKVYWKGSHYKKLIDYVGSIRQQYL